MFKIIETIDDIRPFVAHKKEIAFSKHENGMTVACYQFRDSDTFDVPEALECRGVTFNAKGEIVSRPLHKFFGVGETSFTSLDEIKQKSLKAVFDKIDGSMIATCKTDHGFALRSKQSFQSPVAQYATEYVHHPDRRHFREFCEEVAAQNLTAVFELTDIRQPIVIVPKTPSALSLLHVRDNRTGDYVLLNPNHFIHDLIRRHNIPQVTSFSLSLDEAMSSLSEMTHQEGYVFQFDHGDMAKVKCEWYLRCHRSVTFLREKDVALSALHENLDDVKSIMRDLGTDLSKVEWIERRVKNDLIELMDAIESPIQEDGHLDRKVFVEKHQKHPHFKLLMMRYSGRMDLPLKQYYEQKLLPNRFGLTVLDDLSILDSGKRKHGP